MPRPVSAVPPVPQQAAPQPAAQPAPAPSPWNTQGRAAAAPAGSPFAPAGAPFAAAPYGASGAVPPSTPGPIGGFVAASGAPHHNSTAAAPSAAASAGAPFGTATPHAAAAGAVPPVNPSGSAYTAQPFGAKSEAKGGVKVKHPMNQTLKSFWVTLVSVIVACALTVGILGVSGNLGKNTVTYSGGSSGSAITINPQDANSTTTAEAVAAKASPSVVNIDVYQDEESTIPDYGYGYGYGYGGSGSGSSSGKSGSSSNSNLTKTALGSGVIISSDGYILTCNHVVSDSDKLMVTFDENQPQLEAKIVGQDAEDDLAVIKVNATGLTPISIGDSDAVKVGQWVMAIGSPFGLEKSVTTGIVSAKYRTNTVQSQNELGQTTSTNIYANMIQTDAAINPGNSGGALVDDQGQLIGINALISSSTDSSAGVGFAIPVNYAMNVATQLEKGQAVQHAYMGVSLSDVNIANAQSLGTTATTGAYVSTVSTNSPAAKAGIKKGDVITKIGDESIATADEVIISVREHNVGDVVQVVVNRGGKELTLSVTLGAQTVPGTGGTSSSSSSSSQGGSGSE
jgi:putative serine protease PepD